MGLLAVRLALAVAGVLAGFVALASTSLVWEKILWR
jgi:hypothetical protein